MAIAKNIASVVKSIVRWTRSKLPTREVRGFRGEGLKTVKDEGEKLTEGGKKNSVYCEFVFSVQMCTYTICDYDFRHAPLSFFIEHLSMKYCNG